jgi:hypothetical protein
MSLRIELVDLGWWFHVVRHGISHLSIYKPFLLPTLPPLPLNCGFQLTRRPFERGSIEGVHPLRNKLVTLSSLVLMAHQRPLRELLLFVIHYI